MANTDDIIRSINTIGDLCTYADDMNSEFERMQREYEDVVRRGFQKIKENVSRFAWLRDDFCELRDAAEEYQRVFEAEQRTIAIREAEFEAYADAGAAAEADVEAVAEADAEVPDRVEEIVVYVQAALRDGVDSEADTVVSSNKRQREEDDNDSIYSRSTASLPPAQREAMAIQFREAFERINAPVSTIKLTLVYFFSMFCVLFTNFFLFCFCSFFSHRSPIGCVMWNLSSI